MAGPLGALSVENNIFSNDRSLRYLNAMSVHKTEMLPQSAHVCCWEKNGPAWDVPRGLTHSGHRPHRKFRNAAISYRAWYGPALVLPEVQASSDVMDGDSDEHDVRGRFPCRTG
jgi:hypothetical protein